VMPSQAARKACWPRHRHSGSQSALPCPCFVSIASHLRTSYGLLFSNLVKEGFPITHPKPDRGFSHRRSG
jgi:hypothetical protein